MAVPYAGYVRTKSRQQAQDERRWGQDRFDGAQNSDTPPVKIGGADLARAVNVVCYPDRVEGGYGRRLVSDERLPGSGRRWDLKQHPVTGRWLLHRGGKLWLSAGRRLREWTEVTPIGPDGSLEATGTFTDGVATVTGTAATYLSNMVITGATPGQVFDIEMVDESGPSVVISLYSSGTLVARGTLGLGSQPASGFALVQQGGSGISAVVDVDGYTAGNECVGTATVAEHSVMFSLRGLTLENTDEWELWWEVEIDGSNATLTLYRDAAMTQAVAVSGPFDPAAGTEGLPTRYFLPLNNSGISGGHTWNGGTFANGTFSGTVLEFSFSAASIDADSTISSFGEFGFIVFLRGASPRTIYVEQTISKYLFLSEASGYGVARVQDAGFGDFSYRYLYTYSRIVNPATREPEYSGDRVNSALEFEGPSNRAAISETDYGTRSATDAVSQSDPIAVSLVGASLGAPLGAPAAAYITHISIYRTLNVNDPANNPELYIWVADVPIYSTFYSDTTSDEILLNRFSGGSTQGENFALRSRFFREMEKGIGCIRPDFMATAAPQGTRITYCDVAVNPRFIGYYFPGAQFFLTQDPVSDIVATKDLFVFLCPSSSYTSITAINVDAGTSGVSYIPVIQNFERSSQTVGIKYGQRTFPVDDSSFVSLCSDGTVRVYSATFWGEPIDGNEVHKLVELAQTGAVIIYFRDVLLMWYATDPEATRATHCLRWGRGGNAGSGWTPVERTNWVWPSLGGGMAAVWEDEDALLRMIVVDDSSDAVFAVEDLPPLRQYEDDTVGDGLSIEGTSQVANLIFHGWETTTLYGAIKAADGGVVVRFYESAADRTNDVNWVGTTETLTAPALGVTVMGTIPGTVDVLGIAPVDFLVVPGVRVTGASAIASTLRFRALTATQQQFICFHQESYAFFRAVYGHPMPTVAARWYADEVLVPQSVQSAVPPDGDIQSFAQVRGRTIQFEMQPQSSGWQLTGVNTKYQTQDMRSANGPWNSVEASLQRELAQGMFSWVLGITGLINRADPYYARYVGATPALIEGPSGRRYAQDFATPVTLAMARQVTAYSMMFWVKTPATGLAAAPLAMLDADGAETLYVYFPDATHVNIGSFTYEVPETDEWVHYCVTRDDGSFKTYRNGVLLAADTLTPGTDAAVRSLRIGAQKLYDLRMYAATLSAEAVAYYYNHLNQTPP